MIILILALAGTGVGAAPSLADPPIAMTKIDTATADPNKVLCKTVAVAGSLIPSRVCATKRDWAQRTRNGEDEMRDLSRRNDERPSAIGVGAPLHFVPGLH